METLEKNALISVIVPAYNAGKYFNRCVESIVNQTYKNLEILLINDGSTDDTPVFCDEWADKDSRITVIHKENGGAASARNAGLDAASGDYIGFVDADDTIDCNMYETLLGDIIENEADAARCGINRISDDGKTEGWGSGIYEVRVFDGAQVLKDVAEAFGILAVAVSNKLFKRECINEIRFDTRFKFAEDTFFNFLVAGNINKMVYHDIEMYHYTFNEASITNLGINENNFDEHRVFDLIFQIADEETMPYVVKGDIHKCFRTIRQISASGKYLERFSGLRKRILKHKKAVFTSGIYSNPTKLKTLLIWLAPDVYRMAVKHYSNRKYS